MNETTTTPAPAPVTMSVTYSRGPLVVTSPTFRVYSVEASFGTARGLVWVEDEGGSRPMTTMDFRALHPTDDERRSRDRELVS